MGRWLIVCQTRERCIFTRPRTRCLAPDRGAGDMLLQVNTLTSSSSFLFTHRFAVLTALGGFSGRCNPTRRIQGAVILKRGAIWVVPSRFRDGAGRCGQTQASSPNVMFSWMWTFRFRHDNVDCDRRGDEG